VQDGGASDIGPLNVVGHHGEQVVNVTVVE